MELDELDEPEEQESTASAFSRLGAVALLICTLAAGVLALAGVFEPTPSAAEEPCSVENWSSGVRHCVRDVMLCNACGVVERVRVIPPAQPPHLTSTVSGGGTERIAVLFGALTGRFEISPVRVYQIEVRMKDGSVRAFLQGYEPIWQQGDRVKVQAGRVGPTT